MTRYANMQQLRRAIANGDAVLVTDGHVAEVQPTPAARQVTQASRKVLEDRFAFNWQALGGPELAREHRFHSTRRWRFDFALPAAKLAYEIMGGLYQAQSGHRSRAGVQRDYEKANAAQELGWNVYSLTSDNINDAGYLAHLIEQARQRLESA